MLSRPVALLAMSLSCAVLGCGSGAPEVKHPDRTSVSGTVTYKGSPVEGATVTFHPVQKGGNAAFGTTDELGKYALGTFEKADGAVPGEYTVSIRKLESTGSATQPQPGDPGYDPNPKTEAPKSVLPEKYADPLKSELKQTVGKEPATFDFKLE